MFKIECEERQLRTMLRAFLPIAKGSSPDRTHIHGVIFGSDGSIAATDGHRLHFVETGAADASHTTKLVATPHVVRMLAGLRAIALPASLEVTATHAELCAGDVRLQVPVSSEVTVPWRKIVPTRDGSARPFASAVYQQQAHAFVGAFCQWSQTIPGGGETDAFVVSGTHYPEDGIVKRAAAIVMPVRI